MNLKDYLKTLLKENFKNGMKATRGYLRSLSQALVLIHLCVFTSLVIAGSYEDFFKYVELDNASGVRSLLARGFDPNTPNPAGQLGIILALQEGELKVADAIASSPEFKVDARNPAGETALMIAALTGRLEWCQRLLKQGASLHQPGWSPVHYAAAGPNPDVLKLFVSSGAPVNALSPNGTTPLMMAAQYGAIDGATLLLSRGADPTLRNAQGLTATDFAERADRDRLAAAIDAAAAKAEGRQ